MAIEIRQEQKYGYVPQFRCDVCGDEIIEDGLVAWPSEDTMDQPIPYQTVHNRPCYDVLKARDIHIGFLTIDQVMLHLLYNSGARVESIIPKYREAVKNYPK